MLALLTVTGTWLGCSPQAKYRVLSTFFDGVPNPNAKTAAVAVNAAQEKNTVARQATASVHKPYAEQHCDSCHAGGAEQALAFQSTASLRDSNLCMKCHDKVPTSHPLMHAPVAAKACLFCHSPHESPLPHLLSAAQPGLCTQCHEPALLGKSVPEHQASDSQCLSCHMGHGSETSRYFLRVGQPATRPAPRTQPSLSLSASGPPAMESRIFPPLPSGEGRGEEKAEAPLLSPSPLPSPQGRG
jgi:predicted CXXCH cytochrome family protein